MLSRQVAHRGCFPRTFPYGRQSTTIIVNGVRTTLGFSSTKALHQKTRLDEGRSPEPSAAMIDSQSVKTTELAETQGFEGLRLLEES